MQNSTMADQSIHRTYSYPAVTAAKSQTDRKIRKQRDCDDEKLQRSVVVVVRGGFSDGVPVHHLGPSSFRRFPVTSKKKYNNVIGPFIHCVSFCKTKWFVTFRYDKTYTINADNGRTTNTYTIGINNECNQTTL
jgi:hypothetical protein